MSQEIEPVCLEGPGCAEGSWLCIGLSERSLGPGRPQRGDPEEIPAMVGKISKPAYGIEASTLSRIGRLCVATHNMPYAQ